MQAIAAEPAPRQVMIASSMRLPWISSALINPCSGDNRGPVLVIMEYWDTTLARSAPIQFQNTLGL